jgi:hypothetical protein
MDRLPFNLGSFADRLSSKFRNESQGIEADKHQAINIAKGRRASAICGAQH